MKTACILIVAGVIAAAGYLCLGILVEVVGYEPTRGSGGMGGDRPDAVLTDPGKGPYSRGDSGYLSGGSDSVGGDK